MGIACCIAPALGLLGLPHDTGRRDGWRLQRPRVPAELRSEFLLAGLTGAAVWAVAALFLSVIPSYAASIGRVRNLAALGAISAIPLIASCAAQATARRGALPGSTQAAALGLLVAGLLLLVLASPLDLISLLVIAAVLAGTGHGLGYLAAQDHINRIAPADRRAEINAALYTCVYLGVSLPVIGTGIVTAAASPLTGVAVFASITALSAIGLATRLASRRHRPDKARSS